MRAGRFGRLVVRAVIVGALTLAAWATATMAAHAAFEWEISPAEGPAAPPPPAVEQPIQSGGR